MNWITKTEAIEAIKKQHRKDKKLVLKIIDERINKFMIDNDYWQIDGISVLKQLNSVLKKHWRFQNGRQSNKHQRK